MVQSNEHKKYNGQISTVKKDFEATYILPEVHMVLLLLFLGLAMMHLVFFLLPDALN